MLLCFLWPVVQFIFTAVVAQNPNTPNSFLPLMFLDDTLSGSARTLTRHTWKTELRAKSFSTFGLNCTPEYFSSEPLALMNSS